MTIAIKTYCRICPAFCGLEVDLDGDKIAAVRGDPDNPLSRGYICIKGRVNGEFHQGPDRLRESLARGDDGRLRPIAVGTAMDEISARLREIVAEDGPRAVAVYVGTQGLTPTLGDPLARSFIAALESPCLFSTMTIDQSAKWIAPARMGTFGGGPQSFEDADVWLLCGTNPLVSVQSVALTGFPPFDPIRTMKAAKARGLSLIVIDPRRTETAHFADIHLQPLPGEDPTIFCGLLHVILAEKLENREFCARHVEGIDALRAAVSSFTPGVVAHRADIPQDLLVSAARLFAKGPYGMAGSGTGTDMAPRSNLTQHLIGALNAICGRFRAAGERVGNPGVMSRRRPVLAQVIPPNRHWEQAGPKTRVHGLGLLHGQMPTAVLPDEILATGRGHIRALIVSGGNPAIAFPDAEKTLLALQHLDLLVCIDRRVSETAQFADYVIAPTMAFERADHTGVVENLFHVPYAQYAPAFLEPPPGVITEWEFFYGLAQRMGLTLMFGRGRVLDMAVKPEAEELLAIFGGKGTIPYDEVKKHPSGKIFDVPEQRVHPAEPGANARIDLLPGDVADELRALQYEVAGAERVATDRRPGTTREFTHRLTVRRIREKMNSTGRGISDIDRRAGFNPANLHPSDLDALGLRAGDTVEIESAFGHLLGVVAADETLRPGVVSMTHCYGTGDAREEAERPHEVGGNPNRLVSSEHILESINRMPQMNAIPVRIRVHQRSE